MLLLSDASGNIQYATRVVSHVLGYEPGELLGRDLFDLVIPEELGAPLGWFSAVLDRPGGSLESILRVRHKHGSRLWMESTSTNLVADPEVGAILLQWRDVTDRFEAAQAIDPSVLDRARLEGVLLAARELAHLMNNDLVAAAGSAEIVHSQLDLPPRLDLLLSNASTYARHAMETLTKLHHVVRVATKETPFGPSLDLERSL
jgi:PAS domain S-box-containing protein